MADHFYSVSSVGKAMERKPSDIIVGTASTQHSATFAADQTAVTNAVNALVADGATPTQAHVTTLSNAWTAYLADFVTGNPLELRVTDGAASSKQLYQFCEFLADLAAVRLKQVITPGTLK